MTIYRDCSLNKENARKTRRVSRASARRRRLGVGGPVRACTAVPCRAMPDRDRYGPDVLATDWRAPQRRARRRDHRGQGAGRRGGHHRLVRRDRRCRARPRHRDAGGPTRSASDLPARPRLPPRGKSGDPPATRPLGACGTHPHRLGIGRRAGRPRPGRQGQPHLRRGPTRCRARREGLGRRPAPGRRGRGVPRRRRRPGRRSSPTSGPAPSADRRPGRPPRPRVQGEPDRRRGRAQPGRPARAHRRAPVRRRLAGGEARAPRPRCVADGAASDRVEAGHLPAPRLAAPDQADIARAWQRILAKVRSYQDLEPALLGRVEELIDFVTDEG